MKDIDLNNPELFINRELSWLEFNQRVLDEADDKKNNPIFERIKFLSIVSSNLDEFFMVRVGSLKDQVNANYTKTDASGLTPKQQLKKISLRCHRMIDDQYTLYKKIMESELDKYNIYFYKPDKLQEHHKKFLKDYFNNVVYPVLTPMAVDPGRPFPLIMNKSLNIGVVIENDKYASVQVPSVLPRFIKMPGENNKYEFIFMEDIIITFIDLLFEGKKVESAHPYRITRNADLSIDEDEAEDLLIEIEKSLKQRRWGDEIRLEIEYNSDEKLVNFLKTKLEIHSKDIYYIDGPLDLTFLDDLYSLDISNDLKYKKYEPETPFDLLGEDDIYEAVKKNDIFLHHPYESFHPMVDLIQKASVDPKVLAIKQTLYRVSGESPIVKALEQAAENGKQVTVLVELKARFDEENNIHWARRMEKAGCHVIYGLVGLKTHSKITLIVRNEYDGIKRYVHLGTGNYNDITAKLYTDMSIITQDNYIGADASAFFNALSGYTDTPRFNKLVMAPTMLRDKFTELINREIKNAKYGKKAKIIAKMNSLIDTDIIKKLYEASINGVEIILIVRGICGLRPKVEGISENITVISIVGRFLEHSRVYYFYNGGYEDIYLSSADIMQRNLNRRVELLFPIEEIKIKDRIKNILNIMIMDNVKARLMDESGEYFKVKIKDNDDRINSQEYLCDLAKKRTSVYNKNKTKTIFIPKEKPSEE